MNPALDTLHALRDNWAAGGDMGRPDGFVAVREGVAEDGEAYAVKLELWTDDCLMDLKKQDEAAARRRGEALAKKWAKEHWPHTGYVDLGGAEGVYGATWAWDKATENELERTDPDEVVRLPAARSNPAARKPLDKDLYEAVKEEAKRKFDVWPSAYASGWVVKTYKARGGRYAGGDKKTSSGLTKWFGESWVDLSRPIFSKDGELTGYEPCGRKTAQDASKDPAAYPKCRPLKEAMRMSPSEVKDAIKRKRAAEAKAGRGGRGGRGARAPVRVATYRANPDAVFDKLKEFGAPDAVAAKIAEVVEKVGTCTDAEAMTGKCMVISDRLARELDGMSYVDDYGDTQTVTAFSTQLWDVPKRLQNNALAHGHYVVKVETDACVLWVDLTAAQFGAQGPGVVTGKAVPAVGGFETFWNERVPTYRANPDAADVTSTQAFRRWFGDSEVVDERGEPLVVWHGTDKSFDVFKTRSKSVNSTTFGPVETERSGIFVSDNPEFAREFGSRLLSLYARIENPAEISAAGRGFGRDPALEFAETIDAFTERDLWLQTRHVSRPWQLFDGQLGPRFIAYLQELGYDGATFIEDVPKGDDVGEDEQEYVEGRTYVAFYPEQIKLADGTNTTFDPKNPDVRLNPYDPEDDPLSDVYVIATDELEDGTVVKYVESPFPYERKPLGHNDDPKVQGLVNLATLIGTQRRVSVAGVEKYLGDAERPPRMPPITVYETSDGRQYIADGHHRAVAALIRGLETFPAIIQLVRE